MSRSLAPSAGTSLISQGVRSYELGKTPEAALDLLRTPSNPPILGADEAKRAVGNDPFIVLSGDGFTIYKPWGSRGMVPDGVSMLDIATGPAVTGRLVATPRGSRLQLRVRRYAPAPSQRVKLGAIALGSLAVLVGMIAAAGAHPVLLGIAGVNLLGVLGSVLFYERRKRSQDVRDLLAIVERTFAPLELPPAEDAPYREYDPDDLP